MTKLFEEMVRQTIDKPVKKRWHRISDTITYFGTAVQGTATNARGWSIQKIVDTADGGVCYANDDANDDKIWDIYDSYTYEL